MGDYIALAVVVIILAAVIIYLVKQKKKGNKCIGCPNSSCCGGHCGNTKPQK